MRHIRDSFCRLGRVIAFLVGLIAVVPAAAEAQQTGEISGRVVGPSGTAMPDVNVMVNGTPLATTTDRDGIFRLVNVPVGPQNITIRSLGMKPVTKTLSVVAESPVRDQLLAVWEVRGRSVLRGGQ